MYIYVYACTKKINEQNSYVIETIDTPDEIQSV